MDKKASERFQHLNQPRKQLPTAAYSRFVRQAKIILPLIAAMIVGVLLAWPQAQDAFEAIPQEELSLPTVGQNELLNPRYESQDSKNQPYTITAARAVQSVHDPEVVMLDKPMADITLKDGTWLAVEALKGSYRQNTEQLLLEDTVKLFHDLGYEMKTEKLLVNLKTQEAWSDKDVHGHGPAGTLEATGMQAQTEEGRLIFTGPAKLVLNRNVKGF